MDVEEILRAEESDDENVEGDVEAILLEEEGEEEEDIEAEEAREEEARENEEKVEQDDYSIITEDAGQATKPEVHQEEEGIKIPTRVNNLTSYSSVGNREVFAPLHEIRARFRDKIKGIKEPSDLQANLQFAQVVGLDTLDSISSQLNKNANFQDQGPGLPTSMAVYGKWMALGTSRSIIMIFDLTRRQLVKVFCKSKSFDRLDTACQHGIATESNWGPVSSMDLTLSGSTGNEILIVGYARGRMELWDIAKSNNLKSIPSGPSSHSCAVSCVRFVGTGGPKSNLYDSGNTLGKKPFATVISADTSGVVNMLVFNKTLMLLTFENKCLLDGGAGRIVSMAACEELNMVAISSTKDTFLVSLDNSNARIVHRWKVEMPEAGGEELQSPMLMPRLSWGRAHLMEESGRASFVLARAVGKKIEFLKTAINVSRDKKKKEYKNEVTRNTFVDFSKGSDIYALEWLNDTLLAFLNTDYDLCVFDVSGMAVVERTNVKNVELVWTAFDTNSFSFQNSIRANGATLYLLGIRQLSVAKVQTWTQRVETLILHNGWLEALALGLDHYQLTGHRERERMSDLIMRFVTSKVVPQNDNGKDDSDESRDKRFAATCIEYCAEIERIDLLFDTIYDIFVQCNKGATFLHQLEPYILNRLLVTLRPSVLQDFVQEYVSTNHIPELEQCILHLTPDTIRTDLHTLVSVCKDHSLFAGLVYLYNAGLNDFETPAKILLEMGQTERLLAYIETSFRGLTYPFGFPMEDSTGAEFVRVGLLGFMLENLNAVARTVLFEANDIKELVGLLELGLGESQNEWELRAVQAINALDPSEAVQLCARRLLSHSVTGLKDRFLVEAVIDKMIEDGSEEKLCSILRHCDPSLYDVSLLTTRLQALEWNRALATLHENALAAAIEDGQDILRISNVYAEIIRVSDTPAQFVQQQLLRHCRNVIVRQALEDAFLANLSVLSRINSSTQEKEAAVNVVLQLSQDPSVLVDFPELQFLYMKRTVDLFSGTTKASSYGGALETGSVPPFVVDAASRRVSQQDMERFIELLCQFEPQNVLAFVSENDGLFPLDSALEVCKKYNVYDATAYLLERTGNPKGALGMILDSLDMSGPAFETRRDIVQAAVKVCERNAVTDLDTVNAESLWFLVLGRVSRMVAQDHQYSAILRNLLDVMIEHIDYDKILFNVDSETFGQLRHTIKCMIDARAYESRMVSGAKSVASHDLIVLVRSKHESLARGARAISSFSAPQPTRNHRSRKKVNRPLLSWEEQMQSLLPTPLNIDP